MLSNCNGDIAVSNACCHIDRTIKVAWTQTENWEVALIVLSSTVTPRMEELSLTLPFPFWFFHVLTSKQGVGTRCCYFPKMSFHHFPLLYESLQKHSSRASKKCVFLVGVTSLRTLNNLISSSWLLLFAGTNACICMTSNLMYPGGRKESAPLLNDVQNCVWLPLVKQASHQELDGKF